MWWEYKEVGALIHHRWTSLECSLIVSATIKIHLSSKKKKKKTGVCFSQPRARCLGAGAGQEISFHLSQAHDFKSCWSLEPGDQGASPGQQPQKQHQACVPAPSGAWQRACAEWGSTPQHSERTDVCLWILLVRSLPLRLQLWRQPNRPISQRLTTLSPAFLPCPRGIRWLRILPPLITILWDPQV